jgi:hypothetical protein
MIQSVMVKPKIFLKRFLVCASPECIARLFENLFRKIPRHPCPFPPFKSLVRITSIALRQPAEKIRPTAFIYPPGGQSAD